MNWKVRNLAHTVTSSYPASPESKICAWPDRSGRKSLESVCIILRLRAGEPRSHSRNIADISLLVRVFLEIECFMKLLVKQD